MEQNKDIRVVYSAFPNAFLKAFSREILCHAYRNQVNYSHCPWKVQTCNFQEEIEYSYLVYIRRIMIFALKELQGNWKASFPWKFWVNPAQMPLVV